MDTNEPPALTIQTLCCFHHLIKTYLGKNKRRKYLQVLDGCSASEPQHDQYTFQCRVRSAIAISHLIRNKTNMLTQSPLPVTTVGGGGARLLIKA